MELFKRGKRKAQGPSSLRIQILSDLHLEVGQQYSTYDFPASAPLLLLAGDIGRLVDYEKYLDFLKAQVSRYEKVFLVLGNHEFYGLSYEAGVEQAQRLAAEPSLCGKLVLLHKARWDNPSSDFSIVGCTLWSKIPEDIYDVVQSRVKDYRNIIGWSPTKHNEIHAEEMSWLQKQVSDLNTVRDQRRQVLVATHYAPCMKGTSAPQHAANPWTPAFATDIIPREGWTASNIQTWVYGHTHYSTDFLFDGIRVVANQRGYVVPGSTRQAEDSEKKKRGKHEFDPERAIAIQGPHQDSN